MNFSERHGFIVTKNVIQKNSMDTELRTGLWNVINIYICEPMSRERDVLTENSFFGFFFEFYFSFLKWETDTIPYSIERVTKQLKTVFMGWPWYKIYDFLEFIVTTDSPIDAYDFTESCNFILKRELSGWRMVGDQVTPITNDEELNSIEEALTLNEEKFKSVTIHFAAALSKLSDRTNPDYRNSIKESISAVESIAKIISGKSSDTLNSALDKIKGKLALHRNFEKAVKEMYNYTSDSGGIRHAMKDEITPDFDDAKYMLVICSAFTN